ncbi:MAG: response regulator, partial [Bacteroidetes bacterium]|nr:response regulator [Bacteroidota bacterium]
KRLQLNDLLKENLHLLEISIPKSVKITFTLQDDLWDVEADPGQMQQLVMNLILNAGEAIGDKPGTIHLRTHMQEIEAGDGTWSGGTRDPLAGGRYIVLECEDTGVGMDEETMNRIFDPFFTTKFTGRGLGLSAVQGIIRGHNGGLKVQSKRGAGTTFTIALPARLPEMKQGAEALLPVLLDVSEKILVIDDESFVRDVVVDILQSAGVDVLQADGGEMGIAMFQKYRDQIAAVLLDLSMPGMNGEETFRQLRSVDPNVRVIVSSGYSETEAMASFEPAGVASFIQKPYKGETLLSTLKTVLGR